MQNKSHSIPAQTELNGASNKKPKEFKVFIKGLLTTLPIIILLFVLSLAFSLILGVISPLSELLAPGSKEPHLLVHIAAIIILVLFFYVVGLIVSSRQGRNYFIQFEKKFLSQVPLYTTLRELVKQFSGMKQMPFKQVVLVDPFDSGVLMTAFVTEISTNDIYTVFVPTAPNPTNGNVYHVPISRMHFIDVRPEDAMRTVVGAGTGSKCLFVNASNPEKIEKGLDLNLSEVTCS